MAREKPWWLRWCGWMWDPLRHRRGPTRFLYTEADRARVDSAEADAAAAHERLERAGPSATRELRKAAERADLRLHDRRAYPLQATRRPAVLALAIFTPFVLGVRLLGETAGDVGFFLGVGVAAVLVHGWRSGRSPRAWLLRRRA